MTASAQHELITHPIGQGGTLVLITVRGSVRVRGTDADEARVDARYGGSSGAGRDPLVDGAVRVSRSETELRVEVDEINGGLFTAIGRIVSGGGRPPVDFDVTMPRNGTLRLSGVSADLQIRDLAGDEDVRTVSGDVTLESVSGRISIQSVSGDVRIRGGTLSLEADTTSGDIRAAADRLEDIRIKSISGDVSVAGLLAPGEHGVESISGDLELSPTGGVTVTATGLAGSIRSELPHQRADDGGRRTVIVGDGSATVWFRSMSGNARITRPGFGMADRGTSQAQGPQDVLAPRAMTAPPASPALPAMPTRPAPAVMPAPPAMPAPPNAPWATTPAPAADPFAPRATSDVPAAPWTTASRVAESNATTGVTPPEAPPPTRAGSEIEVLRALERGEIDVEQAARLLEGTGSDD